MAHFATVFALFACRLASAATHVYPDKLAACALQHVAVATIESISGNNIDQLQPVAKPGSISIQRNNSHHLSQQQDEGTQSQYTPVADSDDALIQVTQQLAKTQRKVQDLTKKRDKLEIVLQDFEASAAEERQQLLVQLSAANQQLRQVTQQLEQATGQIAEVTAVRQQLERQLQTAEVALAAAQLAAVKATEEQHQLQAASDEAHAATAAVGLKNNICTSGAVSPQVGTRHGWPAGMGHGMSMALPGGFNPCQVVLCACWPAMPACCEQTSGSQVHGMGMAGWGVHCPAWTCHCNACLIHMCPLLLCCCTGHCTG